MSGLPQASDAISSAPDVRLLSGENDIAQPSGFLENRSRTTASYAQRLPVQIYVTSPHLIWPCHCELPFKVIRDSEVFMAVTFISMSRLLKTYQLPSFISLPATCVLSDSYTGLPLWLS